MNVSPAHKPVSRVQTRVSRSRWSKVCVSAFASIWIVPICAMPRVRWPHAARARMRKCCAPRSKLANLLARDVPRNANAMRASMSIAKSVRSTAAAVKTLVRLRCEPSAPGRDTRRASTGSARTVLRQAQHERVLRCVLRQAQYERYFDSSVRTVLRQAQYGRVLCCVLRQGQHARNLTSRDLKLRSP